MAVPGLPDITFSGLTKTSVTATIVDGAPNGTINSRMIVVSRGADPNDYANTTAIILSPPTKSYGFVGLVTGVQHNFWARERNADGWSEFCPPRSIIPAAVPDAPSLVDITNIRQNAVFAHVTLGSDNGSAHTQMQLVYGLFPSGQTPDPAAAQFSTFSNDVDLSNLVPGETYYFWARGRNSLGWGPYSSVRVITLLAGGMVKVGPVWKRAVPYVKVNGVWKLAKPYSRIAGLWKETL